MFFRVFPGISRVFRGIPGTWKTIRNLFWGWGGGSGRTGERSIPTYSRYFRVFPCFSGFFQVFPGYSGFFQVPGKPIGIYFGGGGGGVWGSWERCFPGYSGSLQVFPGSFQVFPGSLQGIPGFSRFTPGYSGVFQVHSRVFHVFPGISGYFQLFQGIPGYSRSWKTNWKLFWGRGGGGLGRLVTC